MNQKPFRVEWTPEEILKIRKVFRRGGTLLEVAEVLDHSLTPDAIRKRAIGLGMRFACVPKSVKDKLKEKEKENAQLD